MVLLKVAMTLVLVATRPLLSQVKLVLPEGSVRLDSWPTPLDERGHKDVPADIFVPRESERHAGAEVEVVVPVSGLTMLVWSPKPL